MAAPSRRDFLRRIVLACPALASGIAGDEPHPAPRRGIDGSRVLAARELEEYPKAIPVFDMVRRIPQIVDGIRCYCGCDEDEHAYSLLSCFERHGMAKSCWICLGEARLAYRMHRQGKSLAQIRRAIDDEYA